MKGKYLKNKMYSMPVVEMYSMHCKHECVTYCPGNVPQLTVFSFKKYLLCARWSPNDVH